MNIISWNVNGLRAIHRKGNWDTILKKSPDILCLQETKSREDQLSEDLRSPDGYHSYFSWPDEKKGYSGVAIYSKVKPDLVKKEFKNKELNGEGRILEVHFGNLVLFNVYFPNGGGGEERLAYKLDFYDAFLEYIKELTKKGKDIIFCGDVNTAHEEIDLARPKENEGNTGFLPEERAWIDEVEMSGYVDIWRKLNPNKKDSYTYWDMKTRARDRNVGWRIDYFFLSSKLVKKVKEVSILSSMLGSDHCPISLDLK
ncbi:MAG: exodeoxyribonuclease III [Candidatus Pacebacteria bacterium]|nr:exodeoxyribonuclease III [Candidatus Paceibacterota bacterium]